MKIKVNVGCQDCTFNVNDDITVAQLRDKIDWVIIKAHLKNHLKEMNEGKESPSELDMSHLNTTTLIDLVKSDQPREILGRCIWTPERNHFFSKEFRVRALAVMCCATRQRTEQKAGLGALPAAVLNLVIALSVSKGDSLRYAMLRDIVGARNLGQTDARRKGLIYAQSLSYEINFCRTSEYLDVNRDIKSYGIKSSDLLRLLPLEDVDDAEEHIRASEKEGRQEMWKKRRERPKTHRGTNSKPSSSNLSVLR